MSRIELKNIDKYYGKNHVLKNLTLSIEDGEFMTLLGPSGCGKTTTLRVISGLEKPQNGRIEMDGREIVNAQESFFEDPSKRGLNLVFQSYALWPHLTVFNNVAFGLKIKRLSKEEIRTRVSNALERLQILAYIDRYPSELSGGQQQRVAIARAIVSQPKLLLLDEPLSNLDARLRIDMRSELKRLHQELGTTVVYVTHDQVEALTLSTRIAIFFEGELVQVDTPINIYTNPGDLRVADFIGNPRINFVDGQAHFSPELLQVASPLGDYTFSAGDCSAGERPEGEFACVMGIRPEQITLQKAADKCRLQGHIYACQPAGSETLVQVQVDGVNLLAKQAGIQHYKRDQLVGLEIDAQRVTVYNKQSGKLLKFALVEAED
ncbi:MAG: ABC transporter ATP-binding protein [Christensenellales bacterium]